MAGPAGNQGSILRLQEIYKDDGLYHIEIYAIKRIVNAKMGRKCYKVYDDETVCDAIVIPTGIPAFAVVKYLKDYYQEAYERYTILYVYNGDKWSKIILDNYSWA